MIKYLILSIAADGSKSGTLKKRHICLTAYAYMTDSTLPTYASLQQVLLNKVTVLDNVWIFTQAELFFTHCNCMHSLLAAKVKLTGHLN